MTSDMPCLFHDRTRLDNLRKKSPYVVDIILKSGLGKIQGSSENSKLQFCGMVRLPDGTSTIFLPLSLQEAKGSPVLLMSVLARFGRENSKRSFEAEGSNGNCGLLSVISRLSNDFRAHGLFSERQRVRDRDNGKIDWARTIKRERVFPGTDVFGTFHTTRWVDSRETLLAQVQAAVIREIIEIHGWWLEGLTHHRSRLGNVPRPLQPRRLWPALLQALLPRLFSVRAIRLANWLITYLNENSGADTGKFVFGLADFHTVWESMLRATMRGVESNINSNLPKAVYHRSGNEAAGDAVARSMLTDIVLRDCNGGGERYTIIDAKYYAARNQDSLPGWPDIAKQMFYELALKSLVGDGPQIRNCFVFPRDENPQNALYREVVMHTHDWKKDLVSDPEISPDPLEGFPKIEMVYLPVGVVMEAYRIGGQLDFPPVRP